MLKKLRIKFVVITMVIVSAMLCTIFGMLFHFTKTNLENESIAAVKSIADNPMHMGRPGEPNSQIHLPYFTLELGMNGEILSKNGGYYDLSDEDFLEDVLEDVLEDNRQIGALREYNLRFCKSFSPFGQTVVFVDMSSEQAALTNLVQISAFIGLVSFVAFWGISILLARWVVRPVDKAWKQQQQFVSNASHELKTPLTVILSNAQLLQEEPFGEESKKQYVSGIVTMARQMRHLLEQMLELARSDNAQTAPFAPLDFSLLAADAMLPFEPVFFEKGMTLEGSFQPDIQVNGNKGQLKQVLDILLDNAQKYATAKGKTVISLRRQGKNRCVLSVANEGAPIPREDLENLFKRFYRADEARSERGSFGLGLSIAESIVASHKGKIRAQSQEGINTFFVELPTI